MKNYKFEAIVNDRHKIHANDITTLKRLASKAANNNYFSYDKMIVYRKPDDPNNLTEFFHLWRCNTKYPNNTIIRGNWR